jgi:insertion element IS1 protein InsB
MNGWLVCAEEDEASVDLDSLVSKDATSLGRRESRDRSEKTCRRLWEAIPQAYRTGHCYTDFWNAYQAVIPEEQHTAVGKETGQTAHVERWNNTLRQRLARFVRKTLSFSKSLLMHDACLKLFLHRYNIERAATHM